MRRHRMVTCKTALRLGLTALLAASLVRIATAQQDPCLDRTFGVNVLTEKGESVKGLTEQSFRAEYQHQPVQVVSAKRDTAPRRIVIVLDTSGSINQNPQWDAAFTATTTLSSFAPSDTSVALLTFSTGVEERIDFSQGRVAVAKELSNLGTIDWTKCKSHPRKTALLNALVEGLALLESPRVGDAVCAITDGHDNASRINFPEVRRRFLSAGVRLFCFFVRDSSVLRGRTIIGEPFSPEDLAGLVQATGGDLASIEVISPPSLPKWDLTAVQSGTTMLAREMMEFYRVGLRLPQPLDKVGDLKLQVLDESRKKNSHLRIIYPRKLAPCQ